MFHTSEIILDQQALEANVSYLKSEIGENVRFSSVVKGNAYGHGIANFVPMAQHIGLNHFSVFSDDEAYEVKQVAPNAEVMIMGHISSEAMTWAIAHDVSFYVFDLGRLHQAIAGAKKVGKSAKIHIEIETGLNRTGFDSHQLPELTDILLKHTAHLEILGICTHYAGAESIANHVRVNTQIKLFNQTFKQLNKRGLHFPCKHTACSAAAMSYPKSRMDMVRIGILQYGYWPSRETLIGKLRNDRDWKDPLKRIITWKSKVMDVKEVSTGEFIGYGTTFMASDYMKIATVPVGYSHGYSRSLSNHGRVLIQGKRLAVIGMVNMNLIIVDVSECPTVKKEDEVVLIGDQGDQSISVASFSELSDQLNYELLTRLPANIPRRVINQKVNQNDKLNGIPAIK